MSNKQKKSLWKVYNYVQRLIASHYTGECIAYLESLVGTLHEYTAPADL